MNWDIKITKNSKTKLDNTNFNNLGFGNTFSDHMFIADYYDNEWRDCRIVPFDNIEMHPATFVLHYGQSIFEGLKAERNEKGQILLFRPEENAKRFVYSAERIAMPPVPEDLFLKSINELIKIDSNWVPQGIKNTSLYIRPFLYGADPALGVKVGETYRYIVIIGPVGSYYAEEVNIWIQDKYVRAIPGGTGYAKFAGNYAPTLHPVREAAQKGCKQILWTDGIEHKYIQEIGTMNIFLHIGDTLLTPSLEEGTILAGVTRASIIQLAKDKGIKIEERPITVEEFYTAYQDKTLRDMFGTGTAAVVNPIAGFVYKDEDHSLDFMDREVSQIMKKEIEGIKSGALADPHNWVTIVE